MAADTQTHRHEFCRRKFWRSLIRPGRSNGMRRNCLMGCPYSGCISSFPSCRGTPQAWRRGTDDEARADGDSCGMLKRHCRGTSSPLFSWSMISPLEEGRPPTGGAYGGCVGAFCFCRLAGRALPAPIQSCSSAFRASSYRKPRYLFSETYGRFLVGIISRIWTIAFISINPEGRTYYRQPTRIWRRRGGGFQRPAARRMGRSKAATAQDAAREQEVRCTVGECRPGLAISAAHCDRGGRAIGTALTRADLGKSGASRANCGGGSSSAALGNMAVGIAL